MSWLGERALHENDASVVDTDGTGLNSAVASAGGGGGVGGWGFVAAFKYVCWRPDLRSEM